MPTVGELATDALGDLGVLAQGEVPTAAELEHARRVLNRLIDKWAAQHLMISRIARTTWTIGASDGLYTVGTGGDVNVARPTFVESVKFIDTSQSPVHEIPLEPMLDDAWQALTTRTLTSPHPSAFHYDYAFPLANLDLYPIPTSATLTGILNYGVAVAEFATLNDQVALPHGYREMIVSNLAVRLATAYKTQASAELLEAARQSAATVKRSNIRPSQMQVEPAALGSSRFGAYDIYEG